MRSVPGATAPRDIVLVVFPHFEILDLTGPLSAFSAANHSAGYDAYRLSVHSESGGAVLSTSGLAVVTSPLDDRSCDTLMVAGGSGAREPVPPPALVDFARAAMARSRRLTSVCTGAFVLGAAGLLDGRRATTHWRRVGQLQRMFPRIRVEGDRIFVRDGPVWTSAGITAGIDLALALIEEDLGLDVSREVARELVVYHRRPGGQSQFSALLELDPPSDRIKAALRFAREHLHEDLTVERLAAAACLGPRQFGRAFLVETGQTPAKAVERLRAEAARLRIESGREPIEAIARAVGFVDPERMRRAFLRLFGQPPQALRRRSQVDP